MPSLYIIHTVYILTYPCCKTLPTFLDMESAFTASLIERVQTHDSSTIFQCKECPYNSPWSTSAKRHVMAKHVGIQAYNCDLCDNRFSTQNSLNCHRRKHYFDWEALVHIHTCICMIYICTLYIYNTNDIYNYFYINAACKYIIFQNKLQTPGLWFPCWWKSVMAAGCAGSACTPASTLRTCAATLRANTCAGCLPVPRPVTSCFATLPSTTSITRSVTSSDEGEKYILRNLFLLVGLLILASRFCSIEAES